VLLTSKLEEILALFFCEFLH